MNTKTIWDFFINHFRFTGILLVALVLFGFISIGQLPKESDPEVDIPIAAITTVFPGASPLDVEELVTNKIEDNLKGISGINTIDSTSRQGVSSITVELSAKVDRDDVMKDVDDAVESSKRDLPTDAEEPVITEISVNDQPFMQLSLGGPYAVSELTSFAKKVKDVAEQVSGVSNIQIIGGQDEEIKVIIDKARLDTYGLGIRQITNAIALANSDVPVGAIETAGEEFSLRLAGRLTNVDDIMNVPVASVQGIPVRVSDVASVQLGFTEQTSLSNVSNDNIQSTPAVTLLAYKTSGGDITQISAGIKSNIDTLIADEFPEGVDFVIVYDLGDYILNDLRSLSRNGLATIVIVFLILYFFLGLREAIIASLSIPLAFLMTFTYLNIIGYTINFMTLFSLILSLGILVDSAIVVNEAMSTHIRKGMEPFAAARTTVREYQLPLAAGTLTTVFAFVPMLLTSGMIGEFIRSIPVTVTGVLLSSLFVALGLVTTITAAVAKRQLNKGSIQLGQEKKAKVAHRIDMLREKYKQIIRDVLSQKKLQKRIVRYTILAMIVSYSLPVIGVLKIEMFPTSNEPQFAIDVEMPIGSRLEDTQAVLKEIENELHKDEFVTSYVMNVGSASGMGSTGSFSDSHKGNLVVNLVTSGRPTSKEFVDTYQKKLDTTINNGVIRVSQGNFGPPQEAPVVVTISGQELSVLDTLVADFEEVLTQIAGTQNIKSSVEQTNGEFVLYVDRNLVSRAGISTTDLAFTLRNAINGSVATSINSEGEDVEILVRYALNSEATRGGKLSKATIESIQGLTIATPTGDLPLSSLATIKLENARAAINHKDGERIAKVTSFTTDGQTPFAVFAEVKEAMENMDIPDGYSITLGGDNEDINQSFADMGRAMILAMFLIAALLVLQFNSFRQSIIVLLTIPLAMIGVFPGLALLGLPLSFPGIIGIVALVGIVVNNAIILIDIINIKRKEGSSIDEAIMTAGSSRLQPIVLTTMTTVLGIMPLAITEEVWRSLGFAIVFGLLFSTMLTLIFVPMLYKKFYSRKTAQPIQTSLLSK